MKNIVMFINKLIRRKKKKIVVDGMDGTVYVDILKTEKDKMSYDEATELAKKVANILSIELINYFDALDSRKRKEGAILLDWCGQYVYDMSYDPLFIIYGVRKKDVEDAIVKVFGDD